MNDVMALLLSDTYKQCHDRMYPKGLTKLVSYWVPRRSMLKHQDKMVFFGLQAFIKEYLIGYFNDNFFGKTEEDVVSQYKETMNIQIGDGNYDIDNCATAQTGIFTIRNQSASRRNDGYNGNSMY